jgi:hypothetical protein
VVRVHAPPPNSFPAPDVSGVRGLALPDLPATAVSILFAIIGWSEEGASAAAFFVLLLLMCVVQWMRPTLLVWGLLVCLFSAYAEAVIATPHNGTFTDYLLFSLCGAVPAVVLLFGRPKGQRALLS